MFRGWRQRRREARQLASVSSGPADVDGIRAVIAEALASLPRGAAEVTEVHVPEQPDPGLPERLEMRIMPRAPGAADITIRVYGQLDGQSGRVDMYVSESSPIELTTPHRLCLRQSRAPRQAKGDDSCESLAVFLAGYCDH